jgi:two-component sensor histidine kinase
MALIHEKLYQSESLAQINLKDYIDGIVTNSFKYAFPDGRQGIIIISVKPNDTNMIQISISDNGIGIAKDLDIRNTKSLGLKLITSLAESQLHGQIILNIESGTEFQINFRQAK